MSGGAPVTLADASPGTEAQIVAQSVTTNDRTVLIPGGRDGRYVPTGHLVYGLNNVLFAVPFDVGSRQVTGGPVPLLEGSGRQAELTGIGSWQNLGRRNLAVRGGFLLCYP